MDTLVIYFLLDERDDFQPILLDMDILFCAGYDRLQCPKNCRPPMSQAIKVLQVLDLFSQQHTTLSAEEIADLMKISRPTAFRYVRQLCTAGLLSKLSGRYALGVRIIQLDYHIRRFDPILLASREAMKDLATLTACSVVLSNIYGEDVINAHHESGHDTTPFSIGRGQPLPLFRGASAKIILAHLQPARLRRLYEKHRHDKDALAIGADWPTFSRYFRDIRRRGHYVSKGEVDTGVTGISAPIFNDDGIVVGSVTLVFESHREQWINEEGFARLVMQCAADITARIAAAAASTPPTRARRGPGRSAKPKKPAARQRATPRDRRA